MAYTIQGLLGNFRGRFGELVVYEAFGKTIMRRRPGPRSKKAEGRQKRTQDDFARVMHLMQACREFVRAGFSQAAQGRSAFHKALSVNLKRYRQAENKESLEWLLLSQGSRAGAEAASWKRQGDGQLLVSWGKPSNGETWQPQDQVLLMAINQQTLETRFAQKATRSMGQAVLAAPPLANGQQLQVFLAFFNPLSELSGEQTLAGFSDSQMVKAG